MKVTTSILIRWSGLAAMAAGFIFAGIQPIHPADELASVSTSAWANIMPLKTTMGILFVAGIAGLYARQVKESGWLGLAGFVLFSLSWMLQTCYIFAEAFILPLLPAESPVFVASFLGLAHGSSGQMNLGALATIYTLAGLLYIVGGLLLGIATLRARVLPRWPAAFLIAASVVTVTASVVPHPLNRMFAVPMGLAMAWLGYALFAERRETAAQSVPSTVQPAA
jgi:hypothetical protein